MALQQTALDASSKKLHAIQRGYYEDPFMSMFCADQTQLNAPLMNRGQWVRVKAVEYAVARFATLAYPGQPIQVVSIGCGVDTLYFRYAQDGKNTLEGAEKRNADGELLVLASGEQQPRQQFKIDKFLELDVDSMVKYKHKKIKENATLSDIVADSKGVYALETCDLTDLKAVKAVLGSHLDITKPTIIIAECVFVYFREAVTSALLKTITQEIFLGAPHVAVLSYDAIQPNDRFGTMMLQNLAERGIDLAGIHDLPSKEAHQKRCQSEEAGGFKQIRSQTMSTLHNSIPIAIRQGHLNKIEMIDDWDEWEIVMTHYVVVFASMEPAPEKPASVVGETGNGSESAAGVGAGVQLPTIFPSVKIKAVLGGGGGFKPSPVAGGLPGGLPRCD